MIRLQNCMITAEEVMSLVEKLTGIQIEMVKIGSLVIQEANHTSVKVAIKKKGGCMCLKWME